MNVDKMQLRHNSSDFKTSPHPGNFNRADPGKWRWEDRVSTSLVLKL